MGISVQNVVFKTGVGHNDFHASGNLESIADRAGRSVRFANPQSLPQSQVKKNDEIIEPFLWVCDGRVEST